LLNMNEQVLLQELNKVILSNFKKEKKQDAPSDLPILDEVPADGIPDNTVEEFTIHHQEKDLIRILLHYGERPIDITILNEDGHEEVHPVSVAEYIISNLESDEIILESPVYANIYAEYVDLIGKEQFPQPTNFTQHSDQDISGESSAILISPYSLSENWQRHLIYPETEDMHLRKAAKDCVFRLKLKRIQRLILDLHKELEIAVGDDDKYDSLLQEKIMLDRARAEISKYFGTVISH